MKYQSENRTCQNCKNDFVIEPDDFSFYEKMKVPPPTWCPYCRFQRRALFRNERRLFRNINGITGESIISLYPKEAPFPIYEDEYWRSDKWDTFSYGMDFDKSRPFLQQLLELSNKVPRPRSNTINMIHSEYSANAADMKNCYLLFNSNNTEDSCYGNAVDSCKNCFDNSHISNSEKCYESFWLTKCYDTYFSSQCEESFSMYFSKNCIGCSNCFGCVNLVNKSYCFFNKQLSKEEYQKVIQDINLNKYYNFELIKEKVKEFWLKFPVKFFQGIKNYDSSGEYITHSKNVKNSYLVRSGEDLKYVQYAQVPPFKDSMDSLVAGTNSELLYEASVCGWNSAQIKFCWECWDGGIDFEYSMFSGKKANHVFGSISVSEGEYIILNKKYSKEDFYKLRDEIREHMNQIPYIDERGRVYKYGEFFPPEFSPFSYNDTILPEHIPLNREEILSFGAKHYETQKNEYSVTLDNKNIPDDINEVEDNIVNEKINCKSCNEPYRIIQAELIFLRQNNLPIPRFCVECRHRKRISQRNSFKLYPRKCMKEGCNNEFETSYAPDRSEIVYCEKCYQQEVY